MKRLLAFTCVTLSTIACPEWAESVFDDAAWIMQGASTDGFLNKQIRRANAKHLLAIKHTYEELRDVNTNQTWYMNRLILERTPNNAGVQSNNCWRALSEELDTPWQKIAKLNEWYDGWIIKEAQSAHALTDHVEVYFENSMDMVALEKIYNCIPGIRARRVGRPVYPGHHITIETHHPNIHRMLFTSTVNQKLDTHQTSAVYFCPQTGTIYDNVQQILYAAPITLNEAPSPDDTPTHDENVFIQAYEKALYELPAGDDDESDTQDDTSEYTDSDDDENTDTNAEKSDNESEQTQTKSDAEVMRSVPWMFGAYYG